MDNARGRNWWFSGSTQPGEGGTTPGRDQGGTTTTNGARRPGDDGAPAPTNPDRLPSISLPKGGGAIRGIEEKLTVDQATGTARLAVPVFTSPGRNGLGPQLALTYDSAAGNGPCGIGWSLSAQSITRKTSSGLPRYDDAGASDIFMLAGADDLVPLLTETENGWVQQTSSATVGADSFTVYPYRPRVESAFARIERWEDVATGDSHWRTVSKDNVTNLYGADGSSRISDPGDPSHVFSWLLALSFDDRGNAVSYQYKPEDTSNVPPSAHEDRRTVTANRYLKYILYGNQTPYAGVGNLPDDWCFEVVLDYGEHDLTGPLPTEAITWACRIDPFSTYRPGFEVRTYRLCRRILMFHLLPAELGASARIVRSTDITYANPAAANPELPQYTLLESVTQTGWRWPAGASAYQTKQLPPLTFGYSPLAVQDTLQSADADSLRNITGDFGSGGQRWVDLEGEGLPGILTEDDGAWYYKHNLSAWSPGGGPAAARFSALHRVAEKPILTPRDGDLQLTSLNGDGRLCAVNFAPPVPGWFEMDSDGHWQPLQAFAETANVDWSSPELRFVDVDGDGLADVLLTEDDALTFYPWIVDCGLGAPYRVATPFDEDAGPALVFADGTGSIFVADMTGDGLSDLVRIRNGEIVYWPNLGYGHFGPKIVMDGAPIFDHADLFDPRRVRLGDIDGSGTSDLAYVGSNATTIWFNQSGNGWTAPHELTEFPPSDGAVQVGIFDLLGTGTAAAVWTSPLPADRRTPLRYIDLTGGQKPYLLTTISNNVGASTTLTYVPSTQFYLEDQAAGSPWLTRLPFPVHVVAQVQHDEGVSRTSLVSSYTYHHGFYDPTEREFRGFARVDQLDADALPEQSGIGTFTSTPTVTGEEFTLPPVWTRTWYHTGAYFDREDIARRLALEYYQGDPQAPHLGDTALPADANGEELREACRALRGRILRQEIYAQDGTPAAVNPYSSTEYRYEVDQLQPPLGDSYGSYYAWELEHVACHYERQPGDPCITHQLTLTIDGFGNVTRSASAGYPRRHPAFAQQATLLVRYAESDFANVADQAAFYRIGVPVEQRQYQLTGVTPTAPNGLFEHDALGAAAPAAAVLSYEQVPTGTAAQRRLLRRARTIYRADDLSGPLPLGQVESLGLVDRTYQLAYTPGLLLGLFTASGKISSSNLTAALAGPGAFVDLDGDGNQWAPSSRTIYSTDPASPDPSFAAAHFYLPQGSVDPWGNASSIAYDAYDLLVAQTTDALGNTTSAEQNYRVLAPWLATDPNQNRTGVRYDELGMVIATAAMGKSLPGNQDEGDHLDTSTPESSASDDPTTRLEYNLSAYQTWVEDPGRDPEHPAPVWVHTLARVEHKIATTQWLETYAYSDGFGRVALTKFQAEPGDAPERDADGNLVRDAAGNLEFAPTQTRWVGTGRIIYDNKANPVKAYEPFFDSSEAYTDESDLVLWGVTAITRYDPLSRVYRVDNPDGSYRTVEFNSWGTVGSDETDTVLTSTWYANRQAGQLGSSGLDAATKAAAAANTPALSYQDTLGRVFETVADNGPAGQYSTVLTLDIDGHAVLTTDPLGRAALTCDYCPSQRALHHVSVEAGERWILYDAGGQHLLAWDSREHQIRCTYDALRRPTGLYVTTGAGPELLAEQVIYGETLATAQSLNLRGAAYQHQDEAGLATTLQRDFKGNVLSASRQLLADYVEEVDWASSPALTAETFTSSSTYDALNRVVTTTTPDASVTAIAYNQRSLIAAVTVNRASTGEITTIVESVTYDAKGQRLSIDYGNAATTTYSYDPDTFRLAALTTTRPGGTGPLQDLTYAYDPVGNVTQINDAGQQTIFFNNQVVTPSGDYTYDAVYRLTIATGREQIGQAGQPQTSWNDSARTVVPSPADGQAMRNYTENYSYDAVGNVLSLIHTANLGNWTRTYAYDQPSVPPGNNQLTSTTVGGITDQYSYDPHGNVVSMPHLSLMQWDWKDQLQATASQIVNAGTPETTYYLYDSTGQRTLKVTNSSSGVRTAQRIYLGGYEVYREYDATGETVVLERQALHVSDGAKRICLIETTTVDSSPPSAGGPAPALPSTLTRYQLANHLGSAALELDGGAALISYEEYYPYGSTSFQTGPNAAEVSLKRYRYTGKERDAENGFYYHGARYYAPWLGRWTACDPAGFADGVNLYAFVRGNPVRLRDPSGKQSDADTAKQSGVEEAKTALEAAKKEKEEASSAFKRLEREAIRLEDKQTALLGRPKGMSNKVRQAELRQVVHDLEALHLKLIAAGERERQAESQVGAATDALADAERDATGKVAPVKRDTDIDDNAPVPKPPEPRTSYVHFDAQYMWTWNFPTKTSATAQPAPGFESHDPQLVWIPVKDLSLRDIPFLSGLPDNPKFLHEPSLTLTRSTQFHVSGTEVHYEPGAQVDVIDYTLWRLEAKATFGYQLDLYGLHNVGDNSQLLGQGSLALKLLQEPGDGKTPGWGVDLGVQVQKGFWPERYFGTNPWTVAGGLTVHTNW